MSDDPFDARRRVERRPVTLDTVVKGSNGLVQPMTLLNLSSLGFRARGTTPLSPGDHFRFELPRISGAVAKVIWTNGEEFGGQFPTFVSIGGAGQDIGDPALPSVPGGIEHGLRIEYGPPEDRRTVDCPSLHYALEWYDEIVSAGLPFVRIVNAEGDVVSAAHLRKLVAG